MHLGGVCRSVSRILSIRLGCRRPGPERSSSIWDRRHRRPLAAYPYCDSADRLIPDRVGRQHCLALLPVGFT